MKHKILSALVAAAVCFTASAAAVQASGTTITNSSVLSAQTAKASYDETSVYNAMIALQDEYPNGMAWTNDNFYMWNGGGAYTGGYGCVAFAFILSDAAFGDLPSRQINTFEPSAIRVGDIVRYGGHSFIVLEVHEDHFIVAEGNINSSIMWGRSVSFSEIEGSFEHYLTRYPEDQEENTEPITTEPVSEEMTEPTETSAISEIEFWMEVTPPEKVDYYIGEELDLTGLEATVCYITTYNNGTSKYSTYDIPVEELEIFGYSGGFRTEGINVIYVIYEGEIPNVGMAQMQNSFMVTITAETTTVTSTETTTTETTTETTTTETTTETTATETTTEPTDQTKSNLGDADLNGIVNAADAGDVLVAAAAIGAGGDSGLNAEQTANADVDGNGVLDATDAAWILRYAAYAGTGGTMTMEQFFEEYSA